MHTNLQTCLAVVACFLVSLNTVERALVAAELNIDNFEEGPLTESESPATGVTIDQTGLDPSSVIGGERFGFYRIFDGLIKIDSTFSIANEVNSLAYFTLEYGRSADLDLDLSDYAAIEMHFDSIENADVSISSISLELTDGAGRTYRRQLPLVESLTPITLRFSLNDPSSELDYADIDKMEFSTARFGPSFGLDRIVANVPEPSATWLLIGGALLSLGRTRRTRTNHRAGDNRCR